MRNRRMQRRIRRVCGTKEERIGLVDYCGIKDPTPYEAVRNMIRQEQEDRMRYGAFAVSGDRAGAAV